MTHPFVFGELLLEGLPKSAPFAANALSGYTDAPIVDNGAILTSDHDPNAQAHRLGVAYTA